MKVFAVCVISLLLVCGCRRSVLVIQDEANRGVVAVGSMSEGPNDYPVFTMKGERLILSWVTTNFGKDPKGPTPYGVSVQELKDAVSSYCRLQRRFNEDLTTGTVHLRDPPDMLTSEQVRVLRLYDTDIIEAHGTKGPTLMIQHTGQACDGVGSKSCWGSPNQVPEDTGRKLPDPQH